MGVSFLLFFNLKLSLVEYLYRTSKMDFQFVPFFINYKYDIANMM